MTTALGVVPTVGRSALSGLTLAGEPLFVHASRTLTGLPGMRTVLVAEDGRCDEASAALAVAHLADVDVVGMSDVEVRLQVLAGEDVVVLHDPLCPMTPATWVRTLLDRVRPGLAMAAVLPVVDTLKTTSDGVVTGTLDRMGLKILSSPTMFPARTLIDEPGLVALLADPVGLFELLRGRYDVELVEAPSTARRVDDEAGVELLAAALGHSCG